jgi:phage-related baseplate assembly protein
MFSGSEGQDRVRVLMMCEDCRVEAVVTESFDPHAAPQRPPPRTTEDYLRERAQAEENRSSLSGGQKASRSDRGTTE